jgi:hypothetical protein
VCDLSFNVQVICVDWFEPGKRQRFVDRFGEKAAKEIFG